MPLKSVWSGQTTAAAGAVPPPLPIPVIVKDGFLITALCAAFLTFPVMALLGWGGGRLLDSLRAFFGLRISVPLGIVFAIALGLSTLPVLFFVYSRTSRFTLECTKCYVAQGERGSAARLARSVDYQIWFREWKRNPWFRRFALESGLIEESPRLARFNRRLPASA
jgi:hypothetical protein